MNKATKWWLITAASFTLLLFVAVAALAFHNAPPPSSVSFDEVHEQTENALLMAVDAWQEFAMGGDAARASAIVFEAVNFSSQVETAVLKLEIEGAQIPPHIRRAAARAKEASKRAIEALEMVNAYEAPQ